MLFDEHRLAAETRALRHDTKTALHHADLAIAVAKG
jgi:hypothetical protein